MIETLSRYRRVILGALGAVAGLFLIGVLGLLVVFPSERVATIEFRLLFDGAAEGRYPNQTPFSPAEIVATPVATEVFRANDLANFGTYEGFKETLFIQQSNAELDQLIDDYRARLADPRLAAVDRARLEEEFARKREALTDPSFALSLRRSERLKAMPPVLVQKVLTDILGAWSVQAERMGAMKYQVAILTSNVFSEKSLEDADYLVAADMLRAKANRIIQTIEDLEEIPGSLTVRTAKDKVSLPEIRVSIEDALRFDLEPLLGVIRSEGVTKNARLLTLYASNQLFQLRLQKQAAEGRARALRESLQEYMAQRGSRQGGSARSGSAGGTQPPALDTPTLIPQLGESFLDRIVEMSSSTQTREMEYRQKLTDRIIEETTSGVALEKELAYYEDLLSSVKVTGQSRAAGPPELVPLIRARSKAAFSVISKATDQLSDLYTELSAQNLDPTARLYAITRPFSERRILSLSFRSVGLWFILSLVLTMVGVTAACLIHNASRQRA